MATTIMTDLTNYNLQAYSGISLGSGAYRGVISFRTNSNVDNVATIEGQDQSNYTTDIIFFSKRPAAGPSWGGTPYERLRVVGLSTNTGTSVKVNGICEASTGFNVASALKYKKNIHDLPDNYNLDMLMKYRPIMYNLKVDESENPIFFPGFIAEEVEELGAKLFVTYKDEKPEALDYSRICVHLVKAMQEMKTDYDTKISKLEQKYEEMQKMMETLISKI